MKLVVTGALGHIGSKIVRDIPEFFPGSEILMVDNLATLRFGSLFNLPETAVYRFVEADVLTANLEKIVMGADAVLHLAAITDAASSFDNKEQTEHINWNGTVKTAKACAEMGVPMIHISSTSVYGTQADLVDEDCSETELQPQSPYAETKLREERFMAELGASHGLRFVICRFGTICGVSPGMRFHTAVNKFCWQAVMGLPLTVWRTALYQKRPYLVLGDAVNAVGFIVKNEVFDGRIYNVLTENLTVQDIIVMIERDILDLDIRFVDTEIMNQLSYEVLNRRIMELGFQFKGSIKNNIQQTIRMLKVAGGRKGGV